MPSTPDIAYAAALMIKNIIDSDAYITSSGVVSVIQYPNELDSLMLIESDPVNNIIIKDVDMITVQSGLTFDYININMSIEITTNTRNIDPNFSSRKMADQIEWLLNRYNASQDSNTGSLYTPHITCKSLKNDVKNKNKNSDQMRHYLEVTMPIFTDNK